MQPKKKLQLVELLADEIKQRDEFVKEANKEIDWRNGRIAMLTELIAQPAEPEPISTDTPAE